MKGIEAIKAFKEKHGPVKKELADWIKYTNASLSAIRKVLQEGPKTVPEIATASHLPSADVLWFVNALRKYGEASVEGDDGNGYKKYALKETQHA